MPPYSLPSDDEDSVVDAPPPQRVSEQFVQVNVAALRPDIHHIGPHATVERIMQSYGTRPLGYCLLCYADNHETFQCIRARRLRLPPTTITSNQRRSDSPNNSQGPSSAV